MRCVAKVLFLFQLLALSMQIQAQSGAVEDPQIAGIRKHSAHSLSRANGSDVQPGDVPDNRLLVLPTHIIGDQKEFWTTPFRLQKKDMRWIVPLGGATAALIASDSWISKQVPDKTNQLRRS